MHGRPRAKGRKHTSGEVTASRARASRLGSRRRNGLCECFGADCSRESQHVSPGGVTTASESTLPAVLSAALAVSKRHWCCHIHGCRSQCKQHHVFPAALGPYSRADPVATAHESSAHAAAQETARWPCRARLRAAAGALFRRACPAWGACCVRHQPGYPQSSQRMPAHNEAWSGASNDTLCSFFCSAHVCNIDFVTCLARLMPCLFLAH